MIDFKQTLLLGLSGATLALAGTGLDTRTTDSGAQPADPTDAAEPIRAAPAASEASLAWGDYDGDGLDDAYTILRTGSGALLHNEGDGTLRDATQETGLAGVALPSFASWRDVDGDGALDLLVGTRAGLRLFKNFGAGAFEDVAESSGLALEAGAEAAHWLDYDADGRQDLHVRTLGGDVLFHGLADARFERAELPVVVSGVDAAGGFGAFGAFGPFANARTAAGMGASADADGTRPSGNERGPRGALAPRGAGGSVTTATGGSGVVVTNPGGVEYLGSGFENYFCSEAIVDQADGVTCMSASSVPTLGMLYPLSDKLYVDPWTGRVGIGGLSTPWPLTVNAAGDGFAQFNIPENIVVGSYAGEGRGSYGTYTNHPLGFFVHFGQPSMLIDTTGNVGIGTTTPTEKLEIGSNNSPGDMYMAIRTQGGNQYKAGIKLSHFADDNGFTIESDETPGVDGLNIVRASHDTPNSVFFIGRTTGNVGIGTQTPTNKLTVAEGSLTVMPPTSVVPSGSQMSFSTSAGDVGMIIQRGNGSGGSFQRWDLKVMSDRTLRFTDNTANSDRMSISSTGNVGIGTTAPQSGLTVTKPLSGMPTQQGVHLGNYPAPFQGSTGIKIVSHATGDPFIDFTTTGIAGEFGARLMYRTVGHELSLDGNAQFSVAKLKIRGGADIVEGFETTGDESLEPGTVVVIDPNNAGALMQSTETYDLRVAGVVSGANGVSPGIRLGMDGLLDGETQVAMAGRVYVKCSAENGAIRPGDRLTTAFLAGHAMKATDALRCDGAVIGKAMSDLDEGTGFVLVLVNLQ